MITAGSLFSGVGGLDLGAERAGLRVVWQCEANPWRRGVLAARFPGVPSFHDVTTLRVSDAAPADPALSVSYGEADPVRPGPVDVLIGGFPCQDVSLAGAGAGLDGKKSGLWFHYLRLIVATRPRAVLIENVLGLVSRGLPVVVAGLRDAGYSVEATRMRAADLGAPHRRERIFIVAVRGDVPVGGVDEFGGEWTSLTTMKIARWRPDRPDRPEWPTVTTAERANAGGSAPGPRRPPLSELVKTEDWPTPRASDGPSPGVGSSSEGGPPLSHAVREPWPTPTKTDADKNVGYLGGNPSLRIAVRDDAKLEPWPTPTRKGNENREGISARSGDGLGTAVAWTTPNARDWKSTSPATKDNTRPLSEQVGSERVPGPLSPWWTESLMGFPFGWTDPTKRGADAVSGLADGARSGSASVGTDPHRSSSLVRRSTGADRVSRRCGCATMRGNRSSQGPRSSRGSRARPVAIFNVRRSTMTRIGPSCTLLVMDDRGGTYPCAKRPHRIGPCVAFHGPDRAPVIVWGSESESGLHRPPAGGWPDDEPQPFTHPKGRPSNAQRVTAKERGYSGDQCGECGALTLVPNGSCHKCVSCGSTSGCS